MIRCHNCGILFNDKLLTCPNCGCVPIQQGPQNNNYRYSNQKTNQTAQPGPQAAQGTVYGNAQRTSQGTVQGAGQHPGQGTVYGNAQRTSQGTVQGAAQHAGQHPSQGTAQRASQQAAGSGRPSGTGFRKLEFYEQTWFIALALLVVFPVGIALIALRIYKNKTIGEPIVASKKKSKGKLIGGILLIIAGLLFIPSAEDMQVLSYAILSSAIFLGCCLSGIFLIKQNVTANKRIALYESLIDNRGNTPISQIAEKSGRDKTKVRTELQMMIHGGFLAEPHNNIAAYIDGQYDLVVMTHNGKPIVPVEKTVEKRKQARDAAEAEAKRAAAETPEDQAIYVVEDAMASIDNAEVGCYLRSIKSSLENISSYIKEDPTAAEKKSVKKLRTNYIPKTVSLIERYQAPTTTESLRTQIAETFNTIAIAFDNVNQHLRKRVDNETEIDIEVLKKTLERDGYLNSDFEIKK